MTKMSKHRDMEIIKMLHADRATGFRMLFDTYYMPLCLLSVQMTDDFDAAEDIVQTLFVRLWEHPSTLLTADALYAYLFVAVRNNTLAHIKRTGSVCMLPLDQITPDDTLLRSLMETADHMDEATQREEVLRQALQALSEQERRALQATIIDEQPYRVAAQQMGVSVNTLKTYLRRAMAKLRDTGFCALLLFV